MILIAHRGNVDQKIPALENTLDYISRALSLGYHVEIDVWMKNGLWYLGHDAPERQVDIDYLMNDKFWCHAKNLESLEGMLSYNNIRCFWHQEDDVTLTSDNYVWTYPGKKLVKNSICVMPEQFNVRKCHTSLLECAGICSDVIKKYK
jgi:hypothetical protein